MTDAPVEEPSLNNAQPPPMSDGESPEEPTRDVQLEMPVFGPAGAPDAIAIDPAQEDLDRG